MTINKIKIKTGKRKAAVVDEFNDLELDELID